MIILILFILCCLVLAYTFVGYPGLIWLWARGRKISAPDVSEWPRVSIIVPVFNEEEVIEEKALNCLDIDYPEDKLEIVFASDGSTDGSVDILKSLKNSRISILEFSPNAGKAVTLNRSLPGLKGEIVVLSDASGIVQRTTLKKVVRHFANADIGCVCAMYHIFQAGRSEVDSGEHSYLGLEMKLRLWEGRIKTSLSGTGALCAFRRKDFTELPEGLINDDFVIPARIALGGKRVLYEENAAVFDRIKTSFQSAFRRRTRIAYGNWQQLFILKSLLNPVNGYLSWVFYSHKFTRMIMPFVFLALFVLSFPLPSWIYITLSAGVLCSLGAGVLGLMLDRYAGDKNPLAFVALIYLNMAATLYGSIKFVLGKKAAW